MTVSDYPQGKKIVLSTAFDTRPKILNAIYFIVFTCVVGMFINLFKDGDKGIFAFILLVLVVLFYSVLAYRFINKALMSEILLISPSEVRIVSSGFFSKKANSYQTVHIHELHFLKQPEMVKHPLTGDSFDYMGFQARQELVNNLHGDQKISFEYQGKNIAFGENIYSWDFEKIEQIFKEMIGPGFKYNEAFETVFKSEIEEDFSDESNWQKA